MDDIEYIDIGSVTTSSTGFFVWVKDSQKKIISQVTAFAVQILLPPRMRVESLETLSAP